MGIRDDNNPAHDQAVRPAFTLTRRVQFSETDLAGVMHFSNYLRWMEDVEHAFWRSLGLSVHQPNEDGAVSWPRVAVKCEYFSPLRFEQQAELRLRIDSIGGKSLTLSIEFCRDGQRVAAGVTTAVCCRISPGRFEAIAIPAEIREKLHSFSAGGAARG